MMGQEIKEPALHPAPNLGLFLSQGPVLLALGLPPGRERVLRPTNSKLTRLLSPSLPHTPHLMLKRGLLRPQGAEDGTGSYRPCVPTPRRHC